VAHVVCVTPPITPASSRVVQFAGGA
jgi:hypothetical protein